MSIHWQHFVVASIVLACITLVGWQIAQTLVGRKSKLGSCCAKGCDLAPAKPKVAANGRTQFLPLESLSRRK